MEKHVVADRTEDFGFAIDTYHRYAGLLLFAFAKYPCETKDLILRNAVARTAVMLQGIMALWTIRDVQDCYALNRSLMDRLFHIYTLGKNKDYELFDNWSFYEQYKALNRVRSDQQFGASHRTPKMSPTSEQKARFEALSKAPPVWSRPKGEDVAKAMNLSFLYKYGYDYGSRHVHPMSDDGLVDFFNITGLEPRPELPADEAVLSNSILFAGLITQQVLNQSSFRWRRAVYDFLDHLMKHLEDRSLDYGATFLKVAALSQEAGLCEPCAAKSD